MAAAEAKIDSSFIGHSITSRAVLNLQKGTWFGVILGASQAYGERQETQTRASGIFSLLTLEQLPCAPTEASHLP